MSLDWCKLGHFDLSIPVTLSYPVTAAERSVCLTRQVAAHPNYKITFLSAAARKRPCGLFAQPAAAAAKFTPSYSSVSTLRCRLYGLKFMWMAPVI